MAHVQKYSMASAGTLCAHYERAKDSNGEYVLFNNQEIDPIKTYQNYNLAPKHAEGQMGFIRKRISEVKIMNRANVNVMCSWLLTLPKDFQPEDQFFIESYRFMASRYGYENVISAYVHKDEKQPHMHFSFVPVKDGKVIAKEVLNRFELARFHPELKQALEAIFGRDVSVINGSLTKTGSSKGINLLEPDDDTNEITEEIESLLGQRDTLLAEIGKLQKKMLSPEEIEKLEQQMEKDFKKISLKDYVALVYTAKNNQDLKEEIVSLKEQIVEYKEKEEELENITRETPSDTMISENSVLRTRLTNTENRIAKILPYVPADISRSLRNIMKDREPFL